MIRNRVLSSLLAIAASTGRNLGFGGPPRPTLEPLESELRPLSPFRAKGGPRSINGRLKQKRCGNDVLRISRWVERQRRRRARRMNRR